MALPSRLFRQSDSIRAIVTLARQCFALATGGRVLLAVLLISDGKIANFGMMSYPRRGLRIRQSRNDGNGR